MAAGVRGLAGAPVRVVSTGALDAWVSEHAEAPHPVTVELVREHDRVVRAALAWEAPLPARFGQDFPSEGALRRALAEREAALARALERVRGAVEMTVRVLLADPAAEAEKGAEGAREGPSGPPKPPAAPDDAQVAKSAAGREYLSRLRERQRREAELRHRADFLQTRIARAVAGIVLEEARTPSRPSSRSLTISHLVARRALSDYRRALRSFVDGEPGLRVLISGPWAPYSFTEPRRE
ncbi:MAG TPA: GvpL/GvpF family gas vesicle protein [Gemmatimonadaceae bacterium]|nr:GvpL/GvpF family gas vesicle protein [Gemmatimonadaceae bacterium]